MGYHVAQLPRPYDFRVVIEAYVYTRRLDFVHEDFQRYYSGLLNALEGLFGIRLADEGFSFDQRILWRLFESTVSSLVRITSPWDGYLEAGLLHRKLEENGEAGTTVEQASKTIHEANKASAAAHREILYALFTAVFGNCQQVVTSDDLRRAGFDDSKEPDITHYYDYF